MNIDNKTLEALALEARMVCTLLEDHADNGPPDLLAAAYVKAKGIASLLSMMDRTSALAESVERNRLRVVK